jgi:Uma2 family endonuclease
VREPTDARLLDFVESDGEPMGETELHVDQILYLRGALDLLTRVRQQDASAHVGSNLIFYWDPEDARRRLSPDVFLVRGLSDARRRRRTWKLWVEERAPDLVIEVASQSTYELDLGPKRDLYRDVFGVSEYVVYDPEGFMDPGPLVAWRLAGRSYRRAGTSTRFDSRAAGATLEVRDGFLRVVDERGQVVPGDAIDGVREGREAGARDLLRRVLERRFGALTPAVSAAIARLSGADLERAADDAVAAASLAAWLEQRPER